jgi:hypothetical protein
MLYLLFLNHLLVKKLLERQSNSSILIIYYWWYLGWVDPYWYWLRALHPHPIYQGSCLCKRPCKKRETFGLLLFGALTWNYILETMGTLLEMWTSNCSSGNFTQFFELNIQTNIHPRCDVQQWNDLPPDLVFEKYTIVFKLHNRDSI